MDLDGFDRTDLALCVDERWRAVGARTCAPARSTGCDLSRPAGGSRRSAREKVSARMAAMTSVSSRSGSGRRSRATDRHLLPPRRADSRTARCGARWEPRRLRRVRRSLPWRRRFRCGDVAKPIPVIKRGTRHLGSPIEGLDAGNGVKSTKVTVAASGQAGNQQQASGCELPQPDPMGPSRYRVGDLERALVKFASDDPTAEDHGEDRQRHADHVFWCGRFRSSPRDGDESVAWKLSASRAGNRWQQPVARSGQPRTAETRIERDQSLWASTVFGRRVRSDHLSDVATACRRLQFPFPMDGRRSGGVGGGFA